jgi:hypothetical protein
MCRVVARDAILTVRLAGALRPSGDRVFRMTLSVAALRYVVEPVARVGDFVREGDLVARVVSPHADVREAQERAMLHLLESQLADARREALEGGGDAAGQLQVVAAEKRVEQARANVEAFGRVLAGVELRSPFDGVVVEVHEKDATSDAVAVARVVRLDPLIFEAPLPPGLAVPSPGSACEVSAQGRRRGGVARGCAPFATSEGLAVLVVEVANADRAFAAGQRAEVTFDASVQRASFVPASAVLPEPGGLWVWVDGPRGCEARKVMALAPPGGNPELAVSGVVEGELVVADVAAFLRAGGGGRG